MNVLAASDWSHAAIAIAGIGMITIIVSVAIWQVFATGRKGIDSSGEQSYRQVAEDLARMQSETTAELQKANEALAQLRAQTEELGQGLKELDRILKAVE
jgi:hypothetical protein